MSIWIRIKLPSTISVVPAKTQRREARARSRPAATRDIPASEALKAVIVYVISNAKNASASRTTSPHAHRWTDLLSPAMPQYTNAAVARALIVVMKIENQFKALVGCQRGNKANPTRTFV